jgi:hypothetical protein
MGAAASLFNCINSVHRPELVRPNCIVYGEMLAAHGDIAGTLRAE